MASPYTDLVEGGLKRAGTADVEITRVVKPKHDPTPSPLWEDDPRDRSDERAASNLREMTVKTSTNRPDEKPGYRVLEATTMGTAAEAMKHIYENGKMEDLTFSERQQKYKEFIDAFPHATPEDIAGQLLAGAAKALYLGEFGQIFLNDALHYVATTFYKASPSWVSGKYDEDLYDLGEQRAKGAELIRHLQTRFSCFETLERYELADGTDYDELWSNPGARDLKDEVARLVTSSATTPGASDRKIYSQLRVLPEVIPTPALFPRASGALFPEPGVESKWSCNGPASFALEKNGQQSPGTLLASPRFLYIFNRPKSYRAFLLPLTKITEDSPVGDVQLWLHECGCTDDERASVHRQILSGVNFSTMTAFDFQRLCGFAKPRAKALHAAMKTQTLRTAIGIANNRAIENFTNDYDTPRWKAEIMLLHALCEECFAGEIFNDVISSYWNLDTRARERAIDAVLAGVTPIERDLDRLPSFLQQLKLRRVHAFFPRFPSIVSSILNDSTVSVHTIADMQLMPYQSADIMKMLTIYHPGCEEQNKRCFKFWINPELLELISDWYFKCALTATVPAQQPLLLENWWPYIEFPRCERWFQGLLGYKVSIEPAGGLAATPTYKDIVPLQALTTWDLNDYDAYEIDDVSTFLHAVFDPLRIHNKGEPVAEDAVGLIYQGLLDALDALKGDALRLSDALKTPLVQEWVLNEYTAEDDGGRYDTYLFLQSKAFIRFCNSAAGDNNPIDTARWVIAKFQHYHIEKTTIGTKIRQKLTEIWESTEQARGSAESNEDVLVIHNDAIKAWFDDTIPTVFYWHDKNDSAREERLWVVYSLHGDGGQGSSETGTYSDESTADELCWCLEDYSFCMKTTAFRETSGQTIHEVYITDMQSYNDTDDINRGNRLDFTIPDTGSTVHFSRKGHRVDTPPDTWCVRFYTPVHGDSDPDYPFQDWGQFNAGFGEHSLHIGLPQPHPELRCRAAVLILDKAISQADIIKGVADCTIWDHVKENDTFWTAKIETLFKDRHKDFDHFMDKTLKIAFRQVRRSIITPMFVVAAKETLHLRNESNGNVYMLASFTDLAL